MLRQRNLLYGLALAVALAGCAAQAKELPPIPTHAELVALCEQVDATDAALYAAYDADRPEREVAKLEGRRMAAARAYNAAYQASVDTRRGQLPKRIGPSDYFPTCKRS